jgi:hypothetical protein
MFGKNISFVAMRQDRVGLAAGAATPTACHFTCPAIGEISLFPIV